MSNKKPYFPFFVDLSKAKGIIIGGGRDAYEKIQRMQPFGAKLTVIASKFLPEIEAMEEITLINRDFIKADLMPEPDFVVVAVENEEEKQFISELCKERRIPVNVVDDAKYCSYIYSAMVTKGSLTIGISTGGASPAAASIIKEEIEDWLPEEMGEILEWMEAIRPIIQQKFPDKKSRRQIFRKLVKAAMEKEAVLTEAEINQVSYGEK